MKKIIVTLVCLVTFFANAQIVTIPDANFKAKLLAASPSNYIASTETPVYDATNNSWSVSTYHKIDTNNDGQIQVAEAQAVKWLSVSCSGCSTSQKISNLTGIESFTNLQYLNCSNNQLTSLNVSGLTNLQYLSCYNNQLPSLNVLGLTNLKYLNCSNNQLPSLNVSGLANLIGLYCYNNQLTSLNVSGLTNLKYLYCWNNQLPSLNVSGLTNLQSLSCNNNQLTSLNVSGLTNLQTLGCHTNQLTSLNVSGLTNLKYLDCFNNQLTSLNVSGLINLQSLNCYNNQLTSLNVSGLANLIVLYCYENQLPSLDVSGLTNLQTLDCSNNQLTSLNVSGLANLIVLYCYENQLMSLNVSGLINLHLLSCSNNQLPSLNVSGLTNLVTLGCSNNQLPSLDVSGLINLHLLSCYNNQLPSLNVSGLTNLQTLDCYNNQLPSLDVSGLINLINLICYNNQLTSLNVSGLTNLQRLDCRYNQLPSLDVSGLTNLQELYCNNNQLTYLNIKNGINESTLNFSNNPNLQYICADESQLTTVQQKITQYGYTNCHVNSYCSFTPGGTFYTIQGQTTFDNNQNGCDAQDLALPNLKVNITNGSVTGSLIANASGAYNIPVSAGTHTLTPVFENPSYFNVSPASFSVGFPASASPYTQNVCVTPNGVHNDVEVSIIPLTPARPGFDAVYKIVYKNKGNTQLSGAVSVTFQDDKLDFVSANPTTTNQQPSTLTWDYANLLPFETRSIIVTLNVNSPMETPAVNVGDVLTYTATISPTTNDEMPLDNTISFPQTVVGSYDPNDKTCVEGNSITPAMVGNYLHYVIRFENTGNYPAENIVVKDMIDNTKFDISTLQLTQTSHNCTTRITNPNKVEFIFENINLPFDDATNDGYVAFKIKSKSNLVVGNVLKNKADIYFDYNFPITTNETQTAVQVLKNDEFSLQNISIYPNPAHEIITINIPNETPVKAEIFDLNGRLLQTSTLENNQLNISHLKTGNYFVKVYTQTKTGFVKMMID